MAKSLVLIKPDAVSRNLIGEVIKRFEEKGLQIKAIEMLEVPQDILNKHYPLDNREYIITLGHVDVTGWTEEQIEEKYKKSYQVVKSLQDYVTEGPIVKMVVEGPEDTVEMVRDIVGKTDPAASPKGSIRGDLGIDSFEEADKTQRSVRNLVHASGSDEEAEVEIELWFSDSSKKSA